jgi:signal transduction histidine kinase
VENDPALRMLQSLTEEGVDKATQPPASISSLTKCSPVLEEESQRLGLLHSLELLDTPPEAAFDAITRLAAQLTNRPIALIGLVDAERTWFKARVGLEAEQSPREISFCNATLTAEDIFEVVDAKAEPRFADNPLVVGPPHVRYYAGLPLTVAGLPVGSLCVVDHEPYKLDESQRNGLRILRHLTIELLAQRLASRAKSEFIGHLSHEMRTPMNAVLGFGQLIHRQADPGSRMAVRAGHIVTAGRHLLELVNESLDLMRLEAGAVQLDIRPFDIVPVLSEVKDLITPIADERRIEVQLDAPQTLHIHADERRAKQVLLNLTANAIKYGPEGSAIAMTAGGGVEIEPWVSVLDQGPGMTAKQMARLFRPFDRLGQEHGQVQGTGIGLALSKQLVEAMGGRIEVNSELGKGSQFTVKWRRCEAQGSGRAAAPC